MTNNMPTIVVTSTSDGTIWRSGCCGESLSRAFPGVGAWECMNCGTAQRGIDSTAIASADALRRCTGASSVTVR